MKQAIALALVAFMGGAVPTAYATEPFAKVTTTSRSVAFMRAARSVGMGGTGVADPSTPGNVHMNPANAVGAGGASLFYQHDAFLDDYSTNDFGAAYSSGGDGDGWRWGCALRYQRWHWEFDEVRTVFLPEGTGQVVEFTDHYTSGTLAAAMVRGRFVLALGTTARYVSQGLGTSLTGWAYDLGARAQWSFAGENGDAVTLRGGAAVLDLDTDLSNDNLTVTLNNQVRVGAGVDVRTPSTVEGPLMPGAQPLVSVAFNVEYVDLDAPRTDSGLGVGAEVGVAGVVFVRAGSIDNISGYSDGGTWGVGVAAGWSALRVRLDVAGYPLDNWLLDIDGDNTVFAVTVDYLP